MVETMMGRDCPPTCSTLRQVHAEAQQHHRQLQNLLGGVGDAGLGGLLVLPEQGDDHADQDGEHRAAHHLKPLPQQPGGHGDHQADQDAQGVLSDKFHSTIPFSL